MSVFTERRVSFVVLLLVFLTVSCSFVTSNSPEPNKFPFEDIGPGRKVLAVTNMSSLDAELNFTFTRSKAAVHKTTAIQPAAQWKSGTPRMDMKEASLFNANPPPVQQRSSRSVESPRDNTYNPADSKDFWVSATNQNQFTQITATLQYQGEHCNVWVHDDCFTTEEDEEGNATEGKTNASRVQALAGKFDQIYPLAVNLLGYEYGGKPGENGVIDGGIDGDPRIQILVYDIDNNIGNDDPDLDEGKVVGYFWGKDEYTQAELNKSGQGFLKTNLAEIFYIDVAFLIERPELVYSTLIHEFQHMINFNRKWFVLGRRSETWYDEMLSMLAEDVIGPLVEIESDSENHPISLRIPLFLGTYWFAGVNQWLPENEVLFSYSAVYAFGACLIRNYGGPALLAAMLENDTVNQNSVTQALQNISGNTAKTFEEALDRYAEALLYSTSNTGNVPSNRVSFDKTQTSAIGGINYTAGAFDIWSMTMDEDLLKQLRSQNKELVAGYEKGPLILPLLQKITSSGYSLHLQKIPDDVTGLTVIVSIRPENLKENINLKVVPY